MSEIGVITIKNTTLITIGETTLPINKPNLNQILFNGVRVFEFSKPKTNNIAEIINDQILILSPFIRGYKEINKKNVKKTNPKLLFDPIFTLFIFQIIIVVSYLLY